jgi:hypothetical protein
VIVFLLFTILINQCLDLDRPDVVAVVYLLPYFGNYLVDLVHLITMEPAHPILHCLARYFQVLGCGLKVCHMLPLQQILLLNWPVVLLECDFWLKIDLSLSSLVLHCLFVHLNISHVLVDERLIDFTDLNLDALNLRRALLFVYTHLL